MVRESSAMVSFRPYRRAHTPEEAESELRSMAGAQLDHGLVEIFLTACPPQPGTERAALSGTPAAHAPVGWLVQDGAT
jgi:HD-GYP domain-containing protein (c-di-GMP phosphodiesterase class II)